jgi:hypothetical protein
MSTAKALSDHASVLEPVAATAAMARPTAIVAAAGFRPAASRRPKAGGEGDGQHDRGPGDVGGDADADEDADAEDGAEAQADGGEEVEFAREPGRGGHGRVLAMIEERDAFGDGDLRRDEALVRREGGQTVIARVRGAHGSDRAALTRLEWANSGGESPTLVEVRDAHWAVRSRLQYEGSRLVRIEREDGRGAAISTNDESVRVEPRVASSACRRDTWALTNTSRGESPRTTWAVVACRPSQDGRDGRGLSVCGGRAVAADEGQDDE